MEFARKYALVPEDSLSKHTPSEKYLSALDKEMDKILKSSMNEYDKVQRYYEILQKKIKLENYNLPWTSPPAEEENNKAFDKKPKDEDYSSVVLKSVPSKLTKQAGSLLQLMQKNPHIFQWNDQGIITYKGQSIANSNLADLFNLIFTNRKNIDIAAKDEFLKYLHELNVPRHYIKNKNLTSFKQVNTPLKKEKEEVFKMHM